jgi:glycosyltransferase involved in cell wall biosynthesis/ubiquinone/menaquinone biosynthesis C-methylase UbiE
MSPGVPTVSVIMPFLNAARFIAEAIDSVLAQTFGDWELLLIDDGSSDSSKDIARDYAKRFPDRIRVHSHEGGINRGTAASRNLGMAAARGRYLAFLDSDDVYEPERLAHHVREFEQDPTVAVVISAELYWHSWDTTARGQAEPFDRVIGPAVDPRRWIPPPALIVGTLITRGAPLPSPGSFSLRAEALRTVGDVPEGFRLYYEDQVLLCKLLLSFPAKVLLQCLSRYRQHATSITSGNAPLERVPGSAVNRARIQYLQWLREYVRQRELTLPELENWIAAELVSLRVSPSRAAPWRGVFDMHAIAGAVLPRRWFAAIASSRRQVRQRRTRRRVMRYINSRPRTVRDYWNERIDDTKLSDYPRGSAGYYAAHDAYRLAKSDYLPRLVNWRDWAGRDVLEIGCGAGFDLVRAARGGARVTGVDLAPAALELARGYCHVAGVDARLIEADGARLPFADSAFDLVYCMGVLPFADDPAGIVTESLRVLRPGGTAIFMVYNRHSWMNLAVKLKRVPLGHGDAPVFRLYSRREFRELLRSFATCTIAGERLPYGSHFRANDAGRIAACLRPMGWHLTAVCHKGAGDNP